MKRWQTTRGDEWWYSDLRIEMSATAGNGEFFLTIGELRLGTLTSDLLQEILTMTFDQVGSQTRILLSLTKEIEELLDSLGHDGDMAWTIVQNPVTRSASIVRRGAVHVEV